MTCLELQETAPLRLRAGVHYGSVTMTDDGDICGHVVNVASRVANSARHGELLVTDPVRLAVTALSCLAFTDPTQRRFKGLDEPIAVTSTSRIELKVKHNHRPLTSHQSRMNYNHQREEIL